ncbi:MAG: ATP-binding protein [Deltaproteobacteria bacterium]|nr:ATP-binding protein [Deltaproteobacteria bacterium]
MNPGDEPMTTTTTERDERDRVALLRLGSGGIAIGCVVGIVTALVEQTISAATIASAAGVVVAVATIVVAPRRPVIASTAFIAMMTTLVTAVSALFGNRYAGTASLYVLVVMLAGLLLSARAAWITSAISVVAALALFVLDVQGLLPDVNPSPVKRVFAIVISVVVATSLFIAALRRLQAARDDADKKAFELSKMKASLESTVDERTRSLVEARDAAAAASRAKTAFLANMSHELRTPLHAIVGITGLLHARERPKDEREWIVSIEQSSDALLAVLDDVLDLARLEAGRFRIELVSCSPRAVVDEVARLVQPQVARAGLTLIVDVDDAVPRWVSTDPTRLRQVLLNLVGNAVKFSALGPGGQVSALVPGGQVSALGPSTGGPRPGSEVRVRVRRVGSAANGTLRFDVVDFGCGIAPELQSRLFQPFVQGDASSTRKVGGSGLGLAICRELVDLLGGDIDVESSPGHGARFTFTIRAEDAAAPAPAAALSATLPVIPGAATLRVLVVEDNPVNRAVMELMLARIGIPPVCVDGGAAALAHLHANVVDIVLLDVQMPDIDGLEVARQVRAKPGRSPVLIAVTANALPEEEARAKAAGVDEYLTKPVRLEVLAHALARAVRPDTTPAPEQVSS